MTVLAADPAQEEVLNGFVFAIPNSITTKERFEKMNSSWLHLEAMQGLEGYDKLPGKTYLMKVWMTSGLSEKDAQFDESKHSENWADHGHPLLPRHPDKKRSEYFRRAPTFLPADILDVDEGTPIRTSFYGTPVVVVAHQMGFRYPYKPLREMVKSAKKSFEEYEKE